MAPVVWSTGRIIIIPLAIIDWDLHFGWIAIIHTIAAAIVLVAVEVLWVIHVRIVLESRIVSAASSTTPSATVGHGFLSLRYRRSRKSHHDCESRDEDGTSQHNLPPGDCFVSLRRHRCAAAISSSLSVQTYYRVESFHQLESSNALPLSLLARASDCRICCKGVRLLVWSGGCMQHGDSNQKRKGA